MILKAVLAFFSLMFAAGGGALIEEGKTRSGFFGLFLALCGIAAAIFS